MNTLFEPLLEWALRSSLLIAAVALAVALLRKRIPSSARHALWATGITMSLAIPLISLSLPAWAILPSAQPYNEPATISSVANSTAIPVVLESAAAAPTPPSQSPINWSRMAVGVWGLGTVALILKLLAGHRSIRRLIRRHTHRSNPLSEQHATEIRLSYRQIPPMVYGCRRPTILLPTSALDWPAERLDAVISHEQAHIHRRDLVWDGLASILCALQWFNPLVWLAAKKMSAESEHACDDTVIRNGVSPKDYAGHLLEVATTLQPPARSFPAAAMATGIEIETRLKHALDSNRNRSRLGKRRAVVMSIFLAPLVSTFALASDSDDTATEKQTKSESQKKKDASSKVEKGQDGLDIRADSVFYDDKKNRITATGDVSIKTQGDTALHFKASRAFYKVENEKLELLTGTLTVTTKDSSKTTSGGAGLVTYDGRANTIEFAHGFEIIQGSHKITDESAKTKATLDLSTGKLKINGLSKTELIRPK